MAHSIKPENDTFWDASGIAGLKGTLTSSDDIDDLNRMHQTGAYYCNNVSNAPASYGILVMHSASPGGSAAYQMFYTTSGYVFKRYRSSSTWGTWYRIQGHPYGGTNGINYQTPKTFLIQIPKGETRTIRFSAGYGEILSNSAYLDLRGTYLYYATSSGQVYSTAQSAASGLVLTNTGNGISIKNNTSNDSYAYIVVLIFSGDVSEVV